MPILLNAGPSPAGWSRLEAFQRCPQLYAFRHVLKLPFAPTDPLIRGALMHIVLAHYYARLRAVQRGQDPNEFYSPAEALRLGGEALAAEWKTSRPVEVAVLLSNFIEAYEATWATDAFEVLHVEEVAEGRIGGHRYTARLDLVIRDAAGRVWAFDNKSGARVVTKGGKADSRTVARYSLSGQFLAMQHIGKRKWGTSFGGARINFISGPLGGPYAFARCSPEPAPFLLGAFPQVVADAESGIAALKGRDGWSYPKAASDLVCVHSYGRCPGYELCQFGPSAAAQLVKEEWPFDGIEF